MSIVFRESLLLNSVLTNSETWYVLSKKNIEDIENIDKVLLRNILSTGQNTPIPILYLELGCLKIETILKCRRLNFLHYLLSSDKNNSLYKFFDTQWRFPSKNDWTLTVKKDLKDFGIDENLQLIKQKSKEFFKKFIRIKAKDYEMRSLMLQKQEMSKIRYVDFKDLKLSKYLELQDLDTEQAKSIFQYRSRMAKFSGNYRGSNPIKICPLCYSHPDTQQWSFKCSIIKKNIQIEGTYEQILEGDIDQKIAKTVNSILKFREMSL